MQIVISLENVFKKLLNLPVQPLQWIKMHQCWCLLDWGPLNNLIIKLLSLQCCMWLAEGPDEAYNHFHPVLNYYWANANVSQVFVPGGREQTTATQILSLLSEATCSLSFFLKMLSSTSGSLKTFRNLRVGQRRLTMEFILHKHIINTHTDTIISIKAAAELNLFYLILEVVTA